MARKKIKKNTVPGKNLRVVESSKRKGVSLTLAVVSLILNIFAFGIGSLVGGKTKEGVWQIILFILGGVLAWYVTPWLVVLSLAAWVWGIITGLQLIQN